MTRYKKFSLTLKLLIAAGVVSAVLKRSLRNAGSWEMPFVAAHFAIALETSGAGPSFLHPKTRNPGALWDPALWLTKARHRRFGIAGRGAQSTI